MLIMGAEHDCDFVTSTDEDYGGCSQQTLKFCLILGPRGLQLTAQLQSELSLILMQQPQQNRL